MLIQKENGTGWRGTEAAGTSCNPSASRFPAKRILKNRLHNFSFPTMSWGRHRIFRCVNSMSETGLSGAAMTAMGIRSDAKAGKAQPSSSGKLQNGHPSGNGSSEKVAEAMPWNLRKRRAACFAPGENARTRCPSISLSCGQFGMIYPGRSDQMLEGGGLRQRRKFSVSLSREEIEEDFLKFKGLKPPRRPQKRARIVQRQLDELFPGLWLEEVTLDLYKVDDRDESKKV